MKKIIYFVCMLALIVSVSQCKTAKKINTAIAPKDSTQSIRPAISKDSIFNQHVIDQIQKNHLDFNTLTAKIKVEIENADGKQPDITAVVRMIKDSAIWISLTATFLNIEVYRVLVTPQKVILLNKQNKEVQYRTLDYLQEVTDIPFDFKTLQDFMLGNPVFFDVNKASFRVHDNYIAASSISSNFKNLLTLISDHFLMLHSKLDDADITRNRTADISYDNYEFINNNWFARYRQIFVSEKNKLDIRMEFKQVEFNKQLSVQFNIPKNYTRK